MEPGSRRLSETCACLHITFHLWEMILNFNCYNYVYIDICLYILSEVTPPHACWNKGDRKKCLSAWGETTLIVATPSLKLGPVLLSGHISYSTPQPILCLKTHDLVYLLCLSLLVASIACWYFCARKGQWWLVLVKYRDFPGEMYTIAKRPFCDSSSGDGRETPTWHHNHRT